MAAPPTRMTRASLAAVADTQSPGRSTRQPAGREPAPAYVDSARHHVQGALLRLRIGLRMAPGVSAASAKMVSERVGTGERLP